MDATLPPAAVSAAAASTQSPSASPPTALPQQPLASSRRSSPFTRPRRVSSIVQSAPVAQEVLTTNVYPLTAQEAVSPIARVSHALRVDRYDPPGVDYPSTPPPVPPKNTPVSTTPLSSSSLRQCSAPTLLSTSTRVPLAPVEQTPQPSLLATKTLKRKNFKQLSLPTAKTPTPVPQPASFDGLVPAGMSQTSLNSLAENSSLGSAMLRSSSLRRSRAASLTKRSDGSELPLASMDDAQVPGGSAELYYHNNLVEQLATLEIGVEFRLDLRMEDLQTISELGTGNGGTVAKVVHLPTKTLMAKKMIHIEAKSAVRKQIVRELHIMHECHSKYIVSFYGAFANGGDVVMCMEYMDCLSLDRISKKMGPLEEPILGKITEAVVEGLTYLYDLNRIIHRDVKPSNVLVNSQGQIKLCDFGVSGELINSVADTFVGTSTYMSPERIQGAAYSVQSDVWSLGMMLLELGIGHFPFESPDGTPLSILDLLQRIVNEDAPALPENSNFSNEFRVCIDRCLIKDVAGRPSPQNLLSDPFVVRAKNSVVDTQRWARSTL
ncbi:kinase-like domain-containing protein [Limtongia smithiae]|uniref:kinase-like domain-containing protein n=1 Tax=Limtongia smithiae TaxID=1125753 RepID=UPI0034CFB13D